jgi:hypothetical protein
MQLSHAKVGFRELLQCVIAVSACVARFSMLAILPIAVMYMLVMGASELATLSEQYSSRATNATDVADQMTMSLHVHDNLDWTSVK